MPEIELSPGAHLFYRDDDFSDPWETTEPLFLLHGCAESGETYNRWIPALARRFRVIRPDLRGHGRSTPMQPDYPWTVNGVIDDLILLADRLEIERFHLIGGKLGGSLALVLAGTHPSRIRTLTTIAPRTRGKEAANATPDALEKLEREGVESWARNTMGKRLGSDCTPEMFEGWVRLMGKTAPSTLVGFLQMLREIDIAPYLPKITCPTLVITTDGSALGSADVTRSWQSIIKNSELVVLPGDSYHVAATHAAECAAAAMGFIEKAATSA